MSTFKKELQKGADMAHSLSIEWSDLAKEYERDGKSERAENARKESERAKERAEWYAERANWYE